MTFRLLNPEKIRGRLVTKSLGRDLILLDKRTSTNDIATEQTRNGAAHGLTVVSEEQTSGQTGKVLAIPTWRDLDEHRPQTPRLIQAVGRVTIGRSARDCARSHFEWSTRQVTCSLLDLMLSNQSSTRIYFLFSRG
jgi:hypothetical protein